MKDSVIWVHGDCLNPQSPAFMTHANAPAIFVWDDDLLNQWQISLKRIVFIYESLLELPVIIRRGNVAQEVARFAIEQNAQRIVTVESPSSRFTQICDELNQQMIGDSVLEVLKLPSFVEYDGHIDLKRFSRYWRTVKKHAMT